ncbi:hypothetical protein ACFOTA_23380 [Chitinophaga sp. GCM10012297]|uniref:DUF4595 domain-containing protein n=1 Tax=Chitinophaga chungangae TaxID=2821488 RepID=A0ABS3YKF8_9BACT|nr:hypothetical protein [Chitinophaga chungangae]MBO9155172.1 hypothetical protein [Chitinophaga chungangae]
MKKPIAGLLALTLFAASCSDNDNPEPQKLADEYAIIGWDMKFSDENDSSYFRFTYNADSTLKESKEWDQNDNQEDTAYSYASYLDGKLVKLEYKDGFSGTKRTEMSYFYKDGKLARISYYSNGGEVYYYDTLYYNAGGKLSEMHTKYESSPEYNNKKRILTWTGNNITKVEMHRVDPDNTANYKLESVETYTYDNKPNLVSKVVKDDYLWKVESISFEHLSANNATKVEEAFTGTTNKKVRTATFTYDENNKLVKLTNLLESFSGTTLNSSYTATQVLKYVKK